MSLISEALRKVRQETAEGDGPSAGPGRFSAPPPRRSRLGLGLVLGVAVGAAAAIAGGAAVWWALSRPPSGEPPAPAAIGQASSSPSGDPAEDPVAVAPAPVSPSGTAAASQPEGTDPGPPAAEGGASARVEVTAPPPGGPGSASDQTGLVAPADRPARAPATRDRTTTATQGPDGELIFVLDADLGDVTLSLDYIVYKPSSPFAAVNGREVRVGMVIEGFRVDEIGRHQVRLHDDRRTVILRTR